ncbi:bifunctional oligoribonuclease/PAP phosphatase NrnA [Petrotoga sp. 9PWA.NaAc.5.4]|uniref:DHH family phosphoesterase n=1 Tax=Petrotoga sp. 9PWA.NaAc.5.4 TaxID=1434328 RepID=UPI000CBB04B3|nr:bifunctional oligoribonuclease/PAP phosphatase NrnA [Petrotoga sp. 9PWA.NaAc.5.4]PNR95366.1 phosphoesterase [Petrotoga sp. 9PWA.NaAc.5.4]
MQEKEKIIEEILKSNNILIVGHILPDGDDVSSVVSMKSGLEKLNKKCTAVIDDDIPEYLLQFPLVKKEIKDFSSIENDLNKFDLMIVLDASSTDRIGKIEKYLEFFKVVLIDHHATNTHFADINWVDFKMSSTAQMVYRILNDLNVDYDEELATMNLLGIATDTGFFRYQNTGTQVFKDAAALTEKGANISYIANLILDSTPIEHLYLLKDIISNLQLLLNGQIAYTTITLDMLSAYGIIPKDAPSFVEKLRSIRNVEVAIVFQEYERGLYHVSLRSKEWADVSKIAVHFGGGGHPRAAGFSLKTDKIKSSIQEVLDFITKFMKNEENSKIL